MKNQSDTPRVYVACLSSYNAGILHGVWIDIDLSTDEEALSEQIADMLRESRETPAEEWAIHDHENFGGAEIGEHEALSDLVALAHFVGEHGALGGAVLKYADDLEEAKAMLEERYCGAHDSLEAWAESFLDDTGSLDGAPDLLKRYFNYKAYARDAELGGAIITITDDDGQLHVFDAH